MLRRRPLHAGSGAPARAPQGDGAGLTRARRRASVAVIIIAGTAR